MTTRINLIDHSSGLRDTVEIALPHNVVIEQLRISLGEPDFALWEHNYAYARVDGECIVLHFFGICNEAIAAAQNEILGAIWGRVVT